MKKHISQKLLDLIFISGIFLFFTPCINQTQEELDNSQENSRISIHLSSRILQSQQTRMVDSSFETSDAIGLFVLEQTKTLSDNRHVDNALFTFSGYSFSSQEQYYYPDAKLPARFISYYPYSVTGISDGVAHLPIEVNADQCENSSYGLSDFLTADRKSVV